MKAVVLTGLRKMEIVDLPNPKIEKDTDVLLRVGSVGVCGSDVHYYTTGRIGGQIVKYPYRVGHEFAATVVETGKKVRDVKAGDRVAVEPAMACGKCDQCLVNRRHTCRELRFLGCPGQADGCLSEFIAMPAECCFPIKAKTTLDQAAVSEPLSIGVYAAKIAGSLKGKKIAVLGSGPIGLSVLMSAKVSGAEKIFVTDKIDARLKAAKKAGADWTGNPEKQDIVAEVANIEPLMLDVVFECCGQQEALDQGLKLLKPGGKLLIAGIPEVDRVSFPIDIMRHREICIQNVRRQNECMQAAIDLIESGKISVDFMITHHFPMSKAKEAFDMVADYRDGVVKAMIHME